MCNLQKCIVINLWVVSLSRMPFSPVRMHGRLLVLISCTVAYIVDIVHSDYFAQLSQGHKC